MMLAVFKNRPNNHMFTIPTLLTLFRIALIPIFVLTYYTPFEYSNLIAATLFSIIALTDWLDGYLARSLNQSTSFGAFLDPVADKIAVVAALIILVEAYANWWITIPVIIIVLRELVVSALREWLSTINKADSVAVSKLGKIKTTLQLMSIVLLTVAISYPILDWVGILMLNIATLLTLVSMLQYFARAWQVINTKGVTNHDDIRNN